MLDFLDIRGPKGTLEHKAHVDCRVFKVPAASRVLLGQWAPQGNGVRLGRPEQ